jgi:protein SCO1/2
MTKVRPPLLSRVFAALLAGLVLSLAARAEVPGNSLYQLSIALEASDGRTMRLAELRGRPLLITMFYAQCTSVCPLLTSRLQSVVDQLIPADRARLTVVMVTFDSDRDSPQALAEFKKEHHIDQTNWIVARASRQDVRLLSAALGVRYRELPDHTYNHSALISLADADGVVQARMSDVNAQQPDFVRAVHAQLAANP